MNVRHQTNWLATVALCISSCHAQVKSGPPPPSATPHPVEIAFSPLPVRLGQPIQVKIGNSTIGPKIGVFLYPEPIPTPAPVVAPVAIVPGAPTPAPVGTPAPTAGASEAPIITGVSLGQVTLSQTGGTEARYQGELMTSSAWSGVAMVPIVSAPAFQQSAQSSMFSATVRATLRMIDNIILKARSLMVLSSCSLGCPSGARRCRALGVRAARHYNASCIRLGV